MRFICFNRAVNLSISSQDLSAAGNLKQHNWPSWSLLASNFFLYQAIGQPCVRNLLMLIICYIYMYVCYFFSDKMVNVTKGVLVECDPAMKQFLLHLDEKEEFGRKFVLQVYSVGFIKS